MFINQFSRYQIGILFFLFSIINIYKINAQRNPSTIYLKNGQELKGFADIQDRNQYVKFKTEKSEKAIKINHQEIDSVKIRFSSIETVNYTFIHNPIKDKILSMKTEVKGDVTFYINYLPSSTYVMADYYLKRENEDIQYIGYSQGSNKKIRENLREYFRDCEMLVEKIEKKKYKKKTIDKAVEFYNSNCVKK